MAAKTKRSSKSAAKKATGRGSAKKAPARGRGAQGAATRGRAKARGSRASSRTSPSPGRSAKNAVRYAVVGLGHIAQVAVLPAFAHAKRNSRLVALVTSDPVKERKLARKYGAERTCGYEEYDDLLASGDVDAVYIALPNHMHREYAERAARAGVHVLCEKPLAPTVADCEAMIDAAKTAGVRLMTAYRLHFEKTNLEAVRIVKSGKLGDVRAFSAFFSMQVKEGDIRLNPHSMGGGPAYDIGIYCINAARYLFREEPTEVMGLTATNGEARFSECEEMVSGILRFPDDRLATFTASFGADDVSSYRIVGTKGSLRVEPAFEYAEGLEHHLSVGGRTSKRSFAKRDQFAPEILEFSDCVVAGRDPEPDGHEGLADVRVIEALHRSAREGRPVHLEPYARERRPEPSQEMYRPPVEKPELVHASSPHPE
jgi:glucose-fructose oxidoreductase